MKKWYKRKVDAYDESHVNNKGLDMVWPSLTFLGLHQEDRQQWEPSRPCGTYGQQLILRPLSRGWSILSVLWSFYFAKQGERD